MPIKGEARLGGDGATLDAPSPDPGQDHDSQDDLPPEEKGNLFYKYFFCSNLINKKIFKCLLIS